METLAVFCVTVDRRSSGCVYILLLWIWCLRH